MLASSPLISPMTAGVVISVVHVDVRVDIDGVLSSIGEASRRMVWIGLFKAGVDMLTVDLSSGAFALLNDSSRTA